MTPTRAPLSPPATAPLLASLESSDPSQAVMAVVAIKPTAAWAGSLVRMGVVVLSKGSRAVPDVETPHKYRASPRVHDRGYGGREKNSSFPVSKHPLATYGRSVHSDRIAQKIVRSARVPPESTGQPTERAVP